MNDASTSHRPSGDLPCSGVNASSKVRDDGDEVPRGVMRCGEGCTAKPRYWRECVPASGVDASAYRSNADQDKARNLCELKNAD